jgi:MYXO-CTERM domain-containing protein
VPIGEPGGYDTRHYACSSGGPSGDPSGGLPVALVALAACLRRRRRG